MTELHATSSLSWLETLPPVGVELVAMPVAAAPAVTLFPEELELVGDAVAKRRHEFATGRECARRALARFGLPPAPLLRTAGGGVQWPAGYTGSVTHSDAVAAAAVGAVAGVPGLGLDVEELGRLRDALLKRILTPAELTVLQAVPEADRQLLATRAFCAKEALFKCLQPLLNHWFGFQEAEVLLGVGVPERTEADGDQLAIRLGPGLTDLMPAGWRLAARCASGDGLVAAIVWVETVS
jgi:4'-phosphopantetheinyl transferase EntD